jgi:hypothetical protein
MSALLPIATAKADSRKRSCPLYPQKRTCAVQEPMSALGQKRISACTAIKRRHDQRGRSYCGASNKVSSCYRQCGPAMFRERASCAASSTSCWLHLSRGIDFGLLGDRLSIRLICAGVLPRMSYPRRSSSAIASRLSCSTVFFCAGRPRRPLCASHHKKVVFLLAIREIQRQDY